MYRNPNEYKNIITTNNLNIKNLNETLKIIDKNKIQDQENEYKIDRQYISTIIKLLENER